LNSVANIYIKKPGFRYWLTTDLFIKIFVPATSLLRIHILAKDQPSDYRRIFLVLSMLSVFEIKTDIAEIRKALPEIEKIPFEIKIAMHKMKRDAFEIH
jgi:hypothetical protein